MNRGFRIEETIRPQDTTPAAALSTVQQATTMVSGLVEIQILWNLRSCNDSERFQVLLALDEALKNAYLHGNFGISSAVRDGPYEAFLDAVANTCITKARRALHVIITATVSEDSTELKILVQDEGEGFVPQAVEDPTSEEHLEEPSGRGLMLMRVSMDSVSFNEQGNAVTMIKHLRHHVD